MCRLCQIVLCNLYILLSDITTLEVGHAHHRLLCIHTLIYHLCRRMLMGNVVQFVLNCSKELSSEIGVGIVVDACNEDVCHLLIKVTLTTADVPNALQQLTEIPIAPIVCAMDFCVLPFCRSK